MIGKSCSLFWHFTEQPKVSEIAALMKRETVAISDRNIKRNLNDMIMILVNVTKPVPMLLAYNMEARVRWAQA